MFALGTPNPGHCQAPSTPATGFPMAGKSREKQKNNFTKKKRQRNTTPNLCVDVRSSDVVGRFNFTAQYSASNSLGLVAWLLGSCLLQRVPVQVESLQLQPCMLTHKRQYLFCLTWPPQKKTRMDFGGISLSCTCWQVVWRDCSSDMTLRTLIWKGTILSVISIKYQEEWRASQKLDPTNAPFFCNLASLVLHLDIRMSNAAFDPKRIGPHNVSTRKNARFSQSPWIGYILRVWVMGRVASRADHLYRGSST